MPLAANARTCDSVGEQFPGVVRNGKFEILKRVSVEDNYRETIKAFGLEKFYDVK